MSSSSKLTATNVNISTGLMLPFYEVDPGDGSSGEIAYVNGELKYFINDNWLNILDKNADGSTAEKAALSATSLRQTLGASAVNGPYWYKFSDGTTRRLYTDFSTFSNYSFVMSTRLSSADHLQYLTTERNPNDLALTPANLSAPTQSSKLSDAQLNEIIGLNTIRYAIVGPYSVFYRMNDSWISNFGAAASCGYTTPYYNAYATPSNTPAWRTDSSGNFGACGGGYDNVGNWLVLTGIHTNDAAYTGGYTGASPLRATPPSQYTASNAGNNAWGVPGYVFLSW
jgi:hypothetical protein